MEAPKRKYQKRKTESRISVKHYLNTKVKGKPEDQFSDHSPTGRMYYPLYIQITHRGKVNYVKSFLNTECIPEDFDAFKVDRSNDLQEEVEFVTARVELLSREMQEGFTLKNIAGSDEDIYTIIAECLKSEIYDEVILSDEEAKESLLDELTGQPIKEDRNSREYIDKVASVSPYTIGVHWEENVEEVLDTVYRMNRSNSKLSEFKRDFLKKVHFFDLLLSDDLHSGSEVTLGSWQIGYAQARLKRIYKGTDKEIMCDEYIDSIDRLLRRHNKIA